VDKAFRELAARQDSVVRRRQLRDAGVSRGVERAHVQAGRWRPFADTVVILHNGPLTPEQQRWAAVLTAGSRSALAERTALEVAGLRGWEDDGVHILTPRGRTAPPISEFRVVMHETRVPAGGCLAVIGDPQRTRVERSAIDAAGWSPRVRPACGLVAAVVQQRLSTGPRLLVALDAAGAIRHRRALRLALYDITGGAEALSEIDFVSMCRRYDLGRVIHQAVRLDAEGRRRYLDALIESDSGAQVACEVDGAVHLLPGTYWDDMSRANELLIAGQAVLRFPTVALRLDEARAADQIRRALIAIGRAAA